MSLRNLIGRLLKDPRGQVALVYIVVSRSVRIADSSGCGTHATERLTRTSRLRNHFKPCFPRWLSFKNKPDSRRVAIARPLQRFILPLQTSTTPRESLLQFLCVRVGSGGCVLKAQLLPLNTEAMDPATPGREPKDLYALESYILRAIHSESNIPGNYIYLNPTSPKTLNSEACILKSEVRFPGAKTSALSGGAGICRAFGV